MLNVLSSFQSQERGFCSLEPKVPFLEKVKKIFLKRKDRNLSFLHSVVVDTVAKADAFEVISTHMN